MPDAPHNPELQMQGILDDAEHQVNLREHNMAYSAEPGGRRSPGW